MGTEENNKITAFSIESNQINYKENFLQQIPSNAE